MSLGRVWRQLSIVFTVAAIGYVAWSLYETGLATGDDLQQSELWITALAAGALYGLSLLLVAFGWFLLVRGASLDANRSDTDLTLRRGLRIYGASQLLKYLPSNMLHYVGRHAALRRARVSHTAALVGAFGEMALLLPAALIVALLVGYANASGLDWRMLGLLGVIVLALAAGLLLMKQAAPWLGRFGGLVEAVALFDLPGPRQAALGAFACYVLFFLGSGLAFSVVATGAGLGRASDIAIFIAVWSGAWAFGYVTPGAPAGIGVREAFLIAGLGAFDMGEGAPLAALAMRASTTVGDLLLAAIGWAADRSWGSAGLRAAGETAD